MPRRKVPQTEALGFVSELEETGATQVRRGPVDLSGLVEISWVESELERQRRAADLQAWRLPIALSLLFAGVFVLALLVLAL